MRLIDADLLIKLLNEQKEKEIGAYTKGRNTGLNVAKSIINDVTQTPTTYDIGNVSSFEELIANARNKAIDDFAKWLGNKKYLMKEIQDHDFCYTHYDELKSNYVVAEYLEEQLKAGEDNV